MKISLFIRQLLILLIMNCQSAFGGLMSNDFDFQIYRDFAENKGIFSVGSTNIPIYNKNGDYVGVIERVMNFDSVPDAHWGEGALVGGPNFTATAAHEHGNGTLTFGTRAGATQGTPFYDSYKSVLTKNAWDVENSFDYDYRVQRLSKIVTEAEYAPYLTDPEYLNNMKGKAVVSIGSGLQYMATDKGKQVYVEEAYTFLTGGTGVMGSQGISPAKADPADPNKANTYPAYIFYFNFPRPSESNPLPRGGLSGDSGCPIYVFNENTGRWEWLASNQSGGGSGYGKLSVMRSGNLWASDYLASFDRTINVSQEGGDVLWSTNSQNSTGSLTQGEGTTTYTGLKLGLRGDTSTKGSKASNGEMAACNNLVFEGAAGRIVLQSSVDTGAGYLTFNNDYVLSNGGDASRRLNTAGFVVSEGATVTTELTGVEGDEWRKIGEGTLIIAGSGNNAADLNVGGAGLLVLDRENGVAAGNVKLNGGAVTVRLARDKQLSGEFIFGLRGGTVDLYGHDMEVQEVTHLDEGAMFANLNADQEARLIYKGTGRQTYLGGFTDGDGGSLQVIYQGTAEATLTLNGTKTNLQNGGLRVESGEVALQGTLTVHAGDYVNEDDWHYAKASMNVTVGDGALFTLKDHSRLEGNVTVERGGTFRMEPGVLKEAEYVEGFLAFKADMEKSRGLYGLKGNVHLDEGGLMEAAMGHEAGIGQDYSGTISGSGNFLKTGTGVILTLSGANTFSGTKEVREGTLHATGVAALGDCTVNKWQLGEKTILSVGNVSNSDGILNYMDGAACGVLALDGSSSSLERQLDFSSHQSLSLGAREGTVLDYGVKGTSGSLVAAGGRWNIGGGGGTVNVNFLMEGNNNLYVGGQGQGRTGTVILTNENNNFTGDIVVGRGMSLGYETFQALGSARIMLDYGSGLVLHSPDDFISVVSCRVNAETEGILEIQGNVTEAVDMTGYANAFLGAAREGTISGTLSMGDTYRLGGTGHLVIESLLDGKCDLTVDGQGNSGGVISLMQAATVDGAVVVRGSRNRGEDGSITLQAGTDNIISGASQVTLEDGGRLDAAGHRVTLNNFTAEQGSALVNTGESEGVFSMNNRENSVFGGRMEGALKLEKNDATTLTLNTNLGYGTTLAVNDGLVKTVSGYQITAGVLEISGNGRVTAENKALGYGGQIVLKDGGTLELLPGALGVPILHYADIRVENEGYICKEELGPVNLLGNLSVDGTLHKTGRGAVFISNDSLKGRGFIDIREGIFLMGSPGVSEVSFHVAGGARLQMQSNETETFGKICLEDNSNWKLTNISGIFHGDLELKGGTAQMVLDDAAQGSIEGNISGEGKLLVARSGTGNTRLELSGRNSAWTGGAEIQGGSSLCINGAEAMGKGDVTLNGSRMEWMMAASGMDQDASLILKGANTLDTGGNHVVLSSRLEGEADSGFFKDGNGTLELTREQEFQGTATVRAGTLKTSHETALGNGSLVVMDGAALELGESLVLTGSADFRDGAILKMDAGDRLTLKGGVTSGNMVVDFDAIHYTGGTSSLCLIQSESGTLDGNFTLTDALKLEGSRISASFRKDNGGKELYLDIAGSRTVVTWKGSTSAGSVFSMSTRDADHIRTALAQDDHTMYAQDELIFDQNSEEGGETHTVQLAEAGIISSGIKVQGNDNYTLSGGTLSGGGSLTKTGQGTLTLASTGAYEGGSSLEGGTTIATGESAFGSGLVRVSGDAVLELGAGALGDAQLELGGGTLKAAASVLSATSGIKASGNAAMEFTGGGTATQKADIASGVSLSMNTGSNSVIWNGDLSGSGTIVKTGKGVLQLGGGVQSYEGGIRVEQGTLQLGTGKTSAPVLADGVIRVESGATLKLMSNSVAHSNNLEFADGAFFKALDGGGGGTYALPTYDLAGGTKLEGTLNIRFNWDKVTSFSGVISDGGTGKGSLSIAREGGNNLSQMILSGKNTFGGGVDMNAASTRLLVTNRQALGSGALKLNNGELAWLQYTGGFDADVVLGNDGALRVDNSLSGDVEMNSRITGTNLSKTGDGVLKITGELSHTGATKVNGGELVIERCAVTTLKGDVYTGSASNQGTLRFRSDAVISGGALGGYGTVDIAGGVQVTLHSCTDNVAPNMEERRYYGSRITGAGTLELTEKVLALYAEQTSIDPKLKLSGGTLSLQGAAALGQGVEVAGNAGICFLSSSAAIQGSVDVLHGASLAFSNGANVAGSATFTGGMLEYQTIGENKFTVSGGTSLTLTGQFRLELGGLQFDEGMLVPLQTPSTLSLVSQQAASDLMDSYYNRQVSFTLSLAQGLSNTTQWNDASFTLDGMSPDWLGGANLSDVQYQEGMAFLTVSGFVMPEPGSALLILLGSAGFLLARRRQDK